MFIEGLMTLTLLTADSQNGSLDIDVQQEDKENVNKDLNQYDTTLFDKDSKVVNDKIKKKQREKDQKVKNDMFQKQAGQSTRLDETKNILFTTTTKSNNGSESDKSPYIQNEQEKNLLPYILLSIGAFLTLGFILFSIKRGRRS
ncbi:type VII secretion protein EssA [Mammaliicoccus vitulinus]|uniref:Type VII secretion protein EssA n=1 Tax=Mammaliicoccus vitulinus TaxID=71237 RepID=A0A2T4PQN0_9STAP|nr:type VII secretion protein EssA [Mammaliicoccus vitulinus]PTI28141.1 type VII secretion protein EssA [Mammaliicoccus vitulinus]